MSASAETKLELVDNTRTDTFAAIAESQSLRENVAVAVKNYFDQLDGQDVTDVYEMVLSEVEAPLLGISLILAATFVLISIS